MTITIASPRILSTPTRGWYPLVAAYSLILSGSLNTLWLYTITRLSIN